MNWICIGVACAAALCLYLASPHQALWRSVPAALRGKLRWLAVPLGAAAVLLAAAEYGFWCAVFITLSGLMLALVALPYLDAWNRGRHVG
ncbi:hypothetical protein ASD15_28265 [Massilia sp. Root351]|jgi:hypothetical protein|uniref:hypothetical protein n=1 Tax=Massilia sp. Root351 TaxID=1736522 RepID=UPI00070E0EB8|nr:hypothetical protein [Massilia sp. Root351]KQV87140.1 hypothetical protein ASD15_28265 [Massilia sp. Root351]